MPRAGQCCKGNDQTRTCTRWCTHTQPMEAWVFPEGRDRECWPGGWGGRSSPRPRSVLSAGPPGPAGRERGPGVRASPTHSGPSLPSSVSGHGTRVTHVEPLGTGHKHPSPLLVQDTSALLAESVPSGGNIWSVTVTCQ